MSDPTPVTTPAPAPEKPRPRPYFVNATADFLVIGGFSILVFAVLKSLNVTERTEPVWRLAAGLSWIVNWPHFSATSYRLYRSPDNIRQYPVTALVVPVLVFSGVWASFASPAWVAPFFVKFFLIWSPYHFSGQTLGITLLYARRNGFTISKLERLCLSGFIYGTFVTMTAAGEAGLSQHSFHNVSCPTLNLPYWVAEYTRWGMYACGAGFVVQMVFRAVVKRDYLPPQVLLPGVTQYVWFVQGSYVPAFNEFVPFFHSLQYFFIAWAVQLKERADEGDLETSTAWAISESSRWFLFNFVGGALLFFLIPRTLEDYGGIAIGTPVFLSAVQIHHFFVDGVIWKLKNPRVMSPLSVNVGQLVGASA